MLNLRGWVCRVWGHRWEKVATYDPQEFRVRGEFAPTIIIRTGKEDHCSRCRLVREWVPIATDLEIPAYSYKPGKVFELGPLRTRCGARKQKEEG